MISWRLAKIQIILETVTLEWPTREDNKMYEFINIYDLTDEELEELYEVYEYDLYVNSSAGFVDEL